MWYHVYISYAKMIPTVRSVKVYQSDRDIEQYKVQLTGLLKQIYIHACSYVSHV